MRALHVVGENFELGLAVGGRAAVEQHGFDRLLGVGLLRRRARLRPCRGRSRWPCHSARDADGLARAAPDTECLTLVTISLVDKPVPMLAPNNSKSAPSSMLTSRSILPYSGGCIEREDPRLRALAKRQLDAAKLHVIGGWQPYLFEAPRRVRG